MPVKSKPPIRPRAARAAAKRLQVIAAATRVFASGGFVGASMDRIAQEARVSKPTVYRYFPTKDALFDEIMRGVADRMLVHARPGGAHRDGVHEALLEVARDAAAEALSDDVIALQRLATAELGRFPELARRFYENGPRRAVRGFRDFLQHCCERGELNIRDLDMAASHLWSLTVGMPHRTKLVDPEWRMSRASVERWIVAGVQAFMKLYGPTAVAGSRATKAKAGRRGR